MKQYSLNVKDKRLLEVTFPSIFRKEEYSGSSDWLK